MSIAFDLQSRINKLFGESNLFLINDVEYKDTENPFKIYKFHDENIIKLSSKNYDQQAYIFQDNTIHSNTVYLAIYNPTNTIDDDEDDIELFEIDGDFDDYINADEIEFIFEEEEDYNEDNEKEQEVSETRKKWVIRAGKKVKKLICRPGYKSHNNRCVRISAEERRNRKIASRKMSRTMKRISKLSSYKRKRTKSLKKRKMLIRK